MQGKGFPAEEIDKTTEHHEVMETKVLEGSLSHSEQQQAQKKGRERGSSKETG